MLKRAIARNMFIMMLAGSIAGFILSGAFYTAAAAEPDKVYVQPERPEIPNLVVSADDKLPKLTARSAVVMDAVTGKILYERDMHARRYPASTTKIMTLIIALEKGDLYDVITVSNNAAGVEGSTLWLEAGDKIPLGELLSGMMMHSGNDATVAVAEHIAGSVPAFAELMNKKALELGAYETNFVNANGLPDDNHYTTAHDLALIAAYGYSLPHFTDIVGTQEATYDWVKDPAKKLRNENQMLWLYRGANGVKTGYTEKAGRCLVSGAKRDGMQLIAVVLDSYFMWNDSIALLDYGFQQVTPEKLAVKGEIITKAAVADGSKREVPLIAADDLIAARIINNSAKISKKIAVPDKVTAPIKKGDVVGKLVCYYDGEEKSSVALVAAEDVTYRTWFMSLKEWIADFLKGWV